MLLACVYSWWTIATTTGLNLLTNSATSPLPIIGTEIPIAWFYWAAPIILITLFVYLHFYLQHLWALLAQLPAIFPDGKRLDQRAYPWLLTGIVRRHFDLLKKDRYLPDKKDENSLDGEPETWKPRPAITHLKEWVTILLAWWVVPVTLLAFALRYLPRHEVWGTAFHVALLVASIWGAISFYGLAAITLRGEPSRLHRHWVMRLKAWLSAYMAHFRSSNIERADEWGLEPDRALEKLRTTDYEEPLKGLPKGATLASLDTETTVVAARRPGVPLFEPGGRVFHSAPRAIHIKPAAPKPKKKVVKKAKNAVKPAKKKVVAKKKKLANKANKKSR